LFFQTSVFRNGKEVHKAGLVQSKPAFLKMNIINKFLFSVNSILIAILIVIGVYSSKDYSFSILLDIFRCLTSIKEVL